MKTLFDKKFKYIRGKIDGKVDLVKCPVTEIYEYPSPVPG